MFCLRDSRWRLFPDRVHSIHGPIRFVHSIQLLCSFLRVQGKVCVVLVCLGLEGWSVELANVVAGGEYTCQVHGHVQAVWARLRDQFGGSHQLISSPFVLHLQLSQSLCSGESCLELVHAAIKVVLGLVENRIVLQDFKNCGLALESFFSKEKVGESIKGN